MNKNTTAQTEQATFTKGCLAHLEGNQFKAGIAAVANAAIEKIIAGCSDDYEIEQAAYLAAIKEVRKIEAEHGISAKDMVQE
ncbi:MAG: hypothetical protein ACXV79_16560 [Methylobacter sp.]